jgi:hypothetical protein
MMRQLSEQRPKDYGPVSDPLGVIVERLADSDAFQVRSSLYVLLGAVGCLLLIG